MFFSCTGADVFFEYKTIDTQGWNKDSVCTFNVNITDTQARYNVYINIRSQGNYPYQNLWLYLHKNNPYNKQIKDTVECYLADNRGKWLGKSVGSIIEMPVLYEQNVKFPVPGLYQYNIRHGMRNDLLIGVNDIGLRVEILKK
jgi:gliding motility-associated lipoprotein GldH